MNATTPSSATASVSTPTAPMPQNRSALADLGQNIARGIDAAISAKTMDKMADEIANLKATREKIGAETLATTAQEAATRATIPLTSARTSLTRQEKETEEQRTNELKRSVPRQEWEAIKYLDLSNIPDTARRAGNIGSWGGQKVGDVVAPIISSALGASRLRNSFNDRWHY